MKSNHSSRLAFFFSAITLLAFVSCSLMFFSCKKSNPVAPPPPAAPDSTTNDFTWEEISFAYDHSLLKDVFALNDTDVWAVGHLNTLDQFNRLVPHNAVHWDGKTWSIVDVPVPLPGTSYEGPDPLEWVFVFTHNNVWFSTGGTIQIWDGKKYNQQTITHDIFLNGSLRMWGKTPNDVYIVGRKGELAHYDGKFISLESGVPYDINDVWGVGDTALCVAANCLGEESASYVLRLVNGKVEQAYMQNLPCSMKAIWFCKGMEKLTAVGGYYVEWAGNEWKRENAAPLNFYYMSIRGNSPKDYYVVDQTSGIAHFNGKRWTSWKFGAEGDNMFYSLACTKNDVWAVGNNKSGRLLIVHGKRK